MASSEQDIMRKAVYQRPVIRQPTLKEIAAEAKELGISASEKELEQYQALARECADVYQTWANIPEPIPPVRYPRTPGYRPAPEDNPNNAWFWKTDIQGAPKGKLLGKSVAIKDNIAVAGVPMRDGSYQLEGYTADFDATVVTRILDAGGRIAGKSACEDFCFSASSNSPHTGTVPNPVNPLYSAGGSSSGSAALVALGEVDMALGGDQGGSIRMPAAWCGIVGLKPTYSLVPYTGIIPIEQSIDHVGPMTRTVKDCALLLEVLAGYDEGLDPRQSVNVSSQQYTNMLSKDLSGMRVGVVKEGFRGEEPDVDTKVREAAYKLQAAGALVEDISVPMHIPGRGVFLALIGEGSYRTLYQEDGLGHGWKGFYPTSIADTFRKSKVDVDKQASTVKASWIFQSYLTKNYGLHFYAKAMNIGRTVRKAYEEVLKKYDVLVMPTLPHKPYKLITQEAGEDVYEFQHHSWDMILNTPQFNVAGNPALTINAGYSAEGLPIGMQIIGRHFEDGTVLKVAYAFECIRDGI